MQGSARYSLELRSWAFCSGGCFIGTCICSTVAGVLLVLVAVAILKAWHTPGTPFFEGRA